MSDTNVAARDRIAALLKTYPALDEAELTELHQLFTCKATALDLGLLAGDADIAAQFRSYREEHHDRFKAKDLVNVALFVGAVAAVVGAILFVTAQ
ncbi:hypothetical protein [Sphingomonas sp. IC081]|uniref:hypothetical protein n=1 Tax=Sphingomonas sp. IC081 TaxID=304378 RepID=UPI0011594FB3|nr:hypothetical protein [Sphingomonas sp. IC081]